MKGRNSVFNNAASKSVKTVDYIYQVYNARTMPESGDKNSVVQN